MCAVILLGESMAPAQTISALPDAPDTVAANTRLPEAIPVEQATANGRTPDKVEVLPEPMADGEGLKAEPGLFDETGENQVAIGHAAPGVRINLDSLFREMDRPAISGGVSGADPALQHYNMRGMLWQSLAFTATENAFRLFTDANMRRLTADKPYWYDYIASLKQWNMRRWWDGDSFLVDDIGHPMQGGVSAFIEIQNSPRQRELRLSMSREYWRSRLLGMMWATVFSVQQKIGPLGEAALGSDGGITYPLNCPYPCKNYTLGVTKYTNNTGWTDFIMTPMVGSVWVVLEDFLDLEVSDRVQRGHRDELFPNIVRGALNPCRTMANFMRWRMPSYRDFQHETNDLYLTRPIRFLPSDDAVIRELPHFDFFPHFNAISLPVNTASCSHCRQLIAGPGVGFAARITKWADFDSDVNYLANATALPSDRAGGNILSGTFGFRSGYQNNHFAVKAAVRPGFLSYDHAYEASPSSSNPTPDIGRITHFVAALAINADYNVSRHVAFRGVIGNTAVRYREPITGPPGVGKPPYLSWLSHEAFLTNENWTYQTGAVLRF